MVKEVISTIVGRQNADVIAGLKKRLFPQKEPQYKIDFYSQFFWRNDLVFDIGANMGNRVRPFLQIGAKVIAVEPQKSCWKHLKNEFGNKITIVKKGCGAREEVKDFYISETNVLSSFSTEFIKATQGERFSDHEWKEKDEVELTTLDNLIQQFGIPQFIKIDVEGFEPEVLKGLSHKVPYISFEYIVPELRKNALLCIEMLSAINPGATFNYSMGESLVLAGDWLGKEEILNMISSEEFAEKSDFGDIYVRN